MRAYLLVLLLFISSPAQAQVATTTLNKGEPAPARGRWIEEESFTLWWNEYHRLKGEILSLEGRLSDAQARRIQMTALLSESNAVVRAQELTIEDLRLSNTELKATNERMYTGWDVVKYSVGAGAITVLVFIIVRGVQ